jgi:hypothetical protein
MQQILAFSRLGLPPKSVKTAEKPLKNRRRTLAEANTSTSFDDVRTPS